MVNGLPKVLRNGLIYGHEALRPPLIASLSAPSGLLRYERRQCLVYAIKIIILAWCQADRAGYLSILRKIVRRPADGM
jgi:hypothetical protein